MGNAWDAIVNTADYLANERRICHFISQKGYRLNGDTTRVHKVLGLMTLNYQNHGSYFCPCKQSHPLAPATDVVCPCPELDREIADAGNCYCKLIFKV
ncbi:MAG: hypothetical protein JW795_13325 [Chitinivibrionales bacterium]|nr:hypothetical protein [Chitinivibrionales bacterium]